MMVKLLQKPLVSPCETHWCTIWEVPIAHDQILHLGGAVRSLGCWHWSWGCHLFAPRKGRDTPQKINKHGLDMLRGRVKLLSTSCRTQAMNVEGKDKWNPVDSQSRVDVPERNNCCISARNPVDSQIPIVSLTRSMVPVSSSNLPNRTSDLEWRLPSAETKDMYQVLALTHPLSKQCLMPVPQVNTLKKVFQLAYSEVFPLTGKF